MNRLLPRVIAITLGIVLLVYGVQKLDEPSDFLKSIHAYGILPTQPPWILNLTAIGLPWIEIICGLALVIGPLRRGAALLSAGVISVFTTAILVRSFQIMDTDGTAFLNLAFDCGCGSGTVIIWQKLLFNGALIAGTAWVAWVDRRIQAS
ncbi:MAG: DoxX family membrane protein [Planctomycetes bacterium]|nr:DoxX family membrane protein [Planctomycetota bacterium]